VTLGKFAGGMLFLLAMLAPTLLYPVVLAAVSDPRPHPAPVLAGYVGLGWPVPDDLLTLWAWYEEGRWPGAVRDGALVVY